MTKRVNVAFLEHTHDQLQQLCRKNQTYDNLIEEMIVIAGPSVGVNVRREKSVPGSRVQTKAQDDASSMEDGESE